MEFLETLLVGLHSSFGQTASEGITMLEAIPNGLLAIQWKSIGTAALVVSIIGLIIGILLGIAAKVFHVEVDEREIKVRELLPGNNCGGCGYAGCDALAKAIASGKAPSNACPVSPASHTGISKIMGTKTGTAKKQVAFVKCKGTCDKTEIKYHYDGIADCRKLALIPGHGEKVCSYGCMGYGSCVSVCKFDAIKVVNGVAIVDKEKCVSCGKCISECPNHLIELVPYSSKHLVACNSKDKGKDVKIGCSIGCIGCMICVKNCEVKAISVENNLAKIDYTICTGCGVCKEKCPQKIII